MYTVKLLAAQHEDEVHFTMIRKGKQRHWTTSKDKAIVIYRLVGDRLLNKNQDNKAKLRPAFTLLGWMYTEQRQTPADKGYEAGRKGKWHSADPYPEDTQQSFEWYDGWWLGQSDRHIDMDIEKRGGY